MASKKIICAVSSGTYSDYRIIAIFSTEQRARDFMKAIPDSDYNDIEEFELDPKTVDLINMGYSVWRVFMLKDGTVERVEKEVIETYNVTNIGHDLWRRSQAEFYKNKNIPDCLRSRVWAKSKTQAIKIANEQRAQMIALGEWS